MYNRDWDYAEDYMPEEMSIETCEYYEMKDKIEKYQQLVETIKELMEERDRTAEEKVQDIKEEIDDYEND